MMSLTKTSVLAVAWKQFRFKTKIHAVKFITLLAAQLLALLLSFGGVSTSGFDSDAISFIIRYISGDLIVVFSLIWVFVTGYNVAGSSFKQDFTFVSNRLSSHLSSIAFLLASAIIAGVTATLCGVLLRVLAVLVQGGQNYSGLFIPPLDLVSGIYAAILYTLLVSAGGYLFGMLVQKNRAFLVLVPALFLGALFMKAETTGRLLIDAVYFFTKENSCFLFFLKVFLTATLLFGLVILFSNRMEVRK